MIIGISGKIGSGKDTAGMLIQAMTMNPNLGSRYWSDPVLYLQNYEGRPNLKGGFEIKKFAAKLKQIVSILTGIPVEDLEKQEVKDSILSQEWDWLYDAHLHRAPAHTNIMMEGREKKYTVRELLQRVGTEAMRNQIHTNIWINALFADYMYQHDRWQEDQPTAIEHLKYPNWTITDVRFPNEAEAIKKRGGIVLRLERGTPKANEHFSETALDNYEGFYTKIENNGSIEELTHKIKEVLQKQNLITNKK